MTIINRILILLVCSSVLSCLNVDIDCGSENSNAERGLNAALFEFTEIEHLLSKAQILCRTLREGAFSCGFTKTPQKLEGCTPFNGDVKLNIQRGRIVVIDGADTCRVVVHEAVHWLDMDRQHNSPEWPTEREKRAKASCAE